MNEPTRETDKLASEVTKELTSGKDSSQELLQSARDLLSHQNIEAAAELFGKLYVADQATLLWEMDTDDQSYFFGVLSAEQTALILEEMPPEEAAQVVEQMNPIALSEILDVTSQDVSADILKSLPDEQAAQTLRAMLGAQDVIPLMQYANDTAGGLMMPRFPVVRDTMSAAMALDTLRLLGTKAEEFNTLFVVGTEGKLVGDLSITRLALARPTAMVQALMNPNVISTLPDADQEACARLVERHDLSHLPVTDSVGHLLGVIFVEDVVDVVVEEATEDMYRIAGMAGDRVLGPLRNSLRRRLPWLYINLATALFAGAAISLFESSISRVAALAIFLPVVAGEAGVGGTQTLTLVVRGMALGELSPHRSLRLLSREILLGAIHGILLGTAVAVAAYVWKGNVVLGIVVGSALVGNMLIAGLAGAGIPLLLRRLKMDPAVSSAVFITTFTDVVGFVLLLGLATIFIDFL